MKYVQNHRTGLPCKVPTASDIAVEATPDTAPLDTDEVLSLHGTSALRTTWSSIKTFLGLTFAQLAGSVSQAFSTAALTTKGLLSIGDDDASVPTVLLPISTTTVLEQKVNCLQTGSATTRTVANRTTILMTGNATNANVGQIIGNETVIEIPTSATQTTGNTANVQGVTSVIYHRGLPSGASTTATLQAIQGNISNYSGVNATTTTQQSGVFGSNVDVTCAGAVGTLRGVSISSANAGAGIVTSHSGLYMATSDTSSALNPTQRGITSTTTSTSTNVGAKTILNGLYNATLLTATVGSATTIMGIDNPTQATNASNVGTIYGVNTGVLRSGAGAANYMYGYNAAVSFTGTNTTAITEINGAQLSVLYQPSGAGTTCNNTRGLYVQSGNSAAAADGTPVNITGMQVLAYIEKVNTATTTSMFGQYIQAGIISSAIAAKVASLYGSYITTSVKDGVMNAVYGQVIALTKNTGGTATYAYSLTIDSSGVINPSANFWDLYISNSAARNYIAGNVQIGSTTETSGAEKLQVTGSAYVSTTIKQGTYTFATLPAGTVGMRSFITDSTSSTFAASPIGGGAITVPVYYNGTAWLIG